MAIGDLSILGKIQPSTFLLCSTDACGASMAQVTRNLTRIIHTRFCCTRRSAAATSLWPAGSRLGPTSWRRTVMNAAAERIWQPQMGTATTRKRRRRNRLRRRRSNCRRATTVSPQALASPAGHLEIAASWETERAGRRVECIQHRLSRGLPCPPSRRARETFGPARMV